MSPSNANDPFEGQMNSTRRDKDVNVVADAAMSLMACLLSRTSSSLQQKRFIVSSLISVRTWIQKLTQHQKPKMQKKGALRGQNLQ